MQRNALTPPPPPPPPCCLCLYPLELPATEAALASRTYGLVGRSETRHQPMDPVEGGPLRPPSNEAARAWARAQTSRGRSASIALGARGGCACAAYALVVRARCRTRACAAYALVAQTTCRARATMTPGCRGYRMLRLPGGRSCAEMPACKTEEEEIWLASWRPEAVVAGKGRRRQVSSALQGLSTLQLV
eukprot:scaffold30630_cov63-Phaeocystis_antarctica.AAC.3